MTSPYLILKHKSSKKLFLYTKDQTFSSGSHTHHNSTCILYFEFEFEFLQGLNLRTLLNQLFIYFELLRSLWTCRKYELFKQKIGKLGLLFQFC